MIDVVTSLLIPNSFKIITSNFMPEFWDKLFKKWGKQDPPIVKLSK